MSPENLRDEIKALANELGFSACGAAKAGPSEHRVFLEAWLADKRHAGLDWMKHHFDKRVDPTRLLPGTKSVVVFADSYWDPEGHDGKTVAKYACGKDYHKVLKDRIHLIFAALKKKIPGLKGRVCADSAPVLEHYWAQKAGVGWIGKHSLVITRRSGSYVYLGELFLDADVAPDEEASLHCGTCRLCLDACPTGAIVEPYVVDAGRCISYLTIEKREALTEDESRALGAHVFGCDICQDVCPWNHKENFLIQKKPADYGRRFDASELGECGASEVAELLLCSDETDFSARLSDTPLLRAGHAGIQRNLAAVRKNLGENEESIPS